MFFSFCCVRMIGLSRWGHFEEPLVRFPFSVSVLQSFFLLGGSRRRTVQPTDMMFGMFSLVLRFVGVLLCCSGAQIRFPRPEAVNDGVHCKEVTVCCVQDRRRQRVMLCQWVPP